MEIKNKLTVTRGVGGGGYGGNMGKGQAKEHKEGTHEKDNGGIDYRSEGMGQGKTMGKKAGQI